MENLVEKIASSYFWAYIISIIILCIIAGGKTFERHRESIIKSQIEIGKNPFELTNTCFIGLVLFVLSIKLM